MIEHLIRLREQGKISDDLLVLYGISGDMPEITTYQEMSIQERHRFWLQRLENNLGPNWIRVFPTIYQRFKRLFFDRVDWQNDGF